MTSPRMPLQYAEKINAARSGMAIAAGVTSRLRLGGDHARRRMFMLTAISVWRQGRLRVMRVR